MSTSRYRNPSRLGVAATAALVVCTRAATAAAEGAAPEDVEVVYPRDFVIVCPITACPNVRAAGFRKVEGAGSLSNPVAALGPTTLVATVDQIVREGGLVIALHPSLQQLPVARYPDGPTVHDRLARLQKSLYLRRMLVDGVQVLAPANTVVTGRLSFALPWTFLSGVAVAALAVLVFVRRRTYFETIPSRISSAMRAPRRPDY